MKTKKGIVAKIRARKDVSFNRAPKLCYWWIAVAHNGETLAHSEVYTTKRKRDQTGKQVAKQLGVAYK